MLLFLISWTGTAGAVDTAGAGEIGDPSVVMVVCGVEVVGNCGIGGEDNMIDPESLNTKLVGAGTLTSLGRMF